jgi:flagellar motor switch protein FliG
MMEGGEECAMEKPFDFLKNADPSALYTLLRKLAPGDAAIVLSGIPNLLAVQTMAFYPGENQAELMRCMRAARRGEPGQAETVAARVRDLLLEAKKERETKRILADRPMAAPGRENPYARAAAVAGEIRNGNGNPNRSEQLRPWIPRQTEGTPINAPAQAFRQPPVAGNPAESPLIRSGLMDLIGRAREKFLPGARPPARAGSAAPPAARAPSPARATAGTPARGKAPIRRPAAAVREKAGGGARHLDGKAILAAILRHAGAPVRDNVRRADPALYREMRERMFYFDDLTLSDDNALALVFTAAPVAASALALRFAAPGLRERVLRAVSPGRARLLAEAPALRAGLEAVEEAQGKVLTVALQLQAAGRIVIDPNDPDLA